MGSSEECGENVEMPGDALLLHQPLHTLAWLSSPLVIGGVGSPRSMYFHAVSQQ